MTTVLNSRLFFLLTMRGRIVVQVQPFLILRQEHFLEIVLDFFFFDVSKHFDLLFLSFEQILVRGKLYPDPVESIVLVLVFFREAGDSWVWL